VKTLFIALAFFLAYSTSISAATYECKNRDGAVVSGSLGQLLSVMHNQRANRAQVLVTGVITRIRADDLSGSPHQKFTIKVSKDIDLEIVTNLDFGRIPVVVGKTITICGEYLRASGGMVHWTHFDPHGNHPDGFSILDGVLYGDTENPL
jgi:hypothetical protein